MVLNASANKTGLEICFYKLFIFFSLVKKKEK